MRNFGLWTALAVSSLSLIACGDDDGGAAAARQDMKSARTRFNAGPTASFTSANGSKVVAETFRQRSSGDSALAANPLGGGAGGTGTRSIGLGIRSLRLLDADIELASCSDMEAGKDRGSCDCPGGGKLSYDIPNLAALNASEELPDEVDMALAYDACVLGGKKYNGALAMLMSKKDVIDVKTPGGNASSEPGASATNMLVVAKNLSVGSETLNFAFAMNQGRLYYAPEVDAAGGYVLTELSFDGEMRVLAKNGTFECNLDASGEGECKGENGDAVEVAGGDPSSTKKDRADAGADDQDEDAPKDE